MADSSVTVPALQEPADLEAVDLDSQCETCSTTSSFSVRVGATDDDVSGAVPKRLESPGMHEHAEAALHLTSDLKTFINTCIAFLGSGVLGLPYAFRKCGILMGLVTLVGVAAGKNISKYGEIGYFAMGQMGSVIVNTALVISKLVSASPFLDVSKQLVVSVCVPPLVGFSLLRHMRELAYVALLADFMCILGLLVVLNIDLSYMDLDHDYIEPMGVVSAIPFFFGVASYCFEGVGMVLPLENSMRNKHNFMPILVCTVVIITSLYATFGVCGYLAFGNGTDAVITLNFEGSGGLVTLVKVFLCLGLFFTYPVMLFPVFEVLQPMVSCGNKLESPQTRQKRGIVLRAGVVLLTAVIAAGIPGFVMLGAGVVEAIDSVF
ncbi:Amino acid transporter, transmembrane domain [Phytophthora cactorum]|nr:Amino acid transporter, transmembrane domain [Phytophthora cactorum]